MCFIKTIILLFTAVSGHLTNPGVCLKNLVLEGIVILTAGNKCDSVAIPAL